LIEIIRPAYPPTAANNTNSATAGTKVLDELKSDEVEEDRKSVAPSSSSDTSLPSSIVPQAEDATVELQTSLIAKLDIRVGEIVNVEKHPEADSLYVEQIDVGDPEGPRQIVSGLAAFLPISSLLNRFVIVLCNLKPASLKKMKSFGMLLAANSHDGKSVELLEPPTGAKKGEKVSFPGIQADPRIKELPKASEKVWKACLNEFTINENHQAVFQNTLPFTTSAGVVTVPTLKGVKIK